MSEMVERVAGAIVAALASSLGLSEQETYRFVARAAIEAMREPTTAMLKRGDQGQSSEYVWHAMVDAALASSTPK